MGRIIDARIGLFAALLSGVALYGLAMGATYPLLALVLAGRESDFWNGVNVTGTGLGLVLGVWLMPGLVRRWGAGATASLGVGLMALCLLALSSTEDYAAMFFLRLLMGLGANLMFVITETGLNAIGSKHRRGRLLGLYAMLTALGFVLGPALVALAPGAPDILLAACAAVALLALVPFLWVRRVLDAKVPAAGGMRLVQSLRAVPAAFVFLFIASAVDAVAISLLPVISLRAGFGAGEGALLVTIFHLGLIAGQPVVGWLLDVWGRRRTILGCVSACMLATIVLAVAGSGDFAVSAIALFVWGAANFGLYTAGLTLIGDRFAGTALSAATLSFAFIYAVAAIIAPTLIGLGLETVLPAGLYAMTGALYLGTLVWAIGQLRPLEPAWDAS